MENNKILNDYDTFLDNIEFIENYFYCEDCIDITLVNTNPFEYEFMCSECGKTYIFDKDEIKLKKERNKNDK